MKHHVVIAAGGQAFEFEGEITELEEDYIILQAKRGEIYIERKHLVFIQTLNEEVEIKDEIIPEVPLPIVARSSKVDQAARFVNKRLKQDPLEQKLVGKMIPPSQFPDDGNDPIIEVDEDEEAMSNVMAAYHGPDNPLTRATNLRQAAQIAMKTEDDFSMGMGGIEYKSPLQMVLGLKNAGNKKTRTS